MKVILEFPIWIRHVDKTYVISPLFFNGVNADGKVYDDVSSRFYSNLAKEFAHYKLRDYGYQELFWYTFNPEFRFEILKLSFESGKRFISECFSTAWFRAFGQTIICLPSFNHYFFVSSKPEINNTDELQEEVMLHLQMLGRKYKKQTGNDFEFDKYSSSGKEQVDISEKTKILVYYPRYRESSISIDFFQSLSVQKVFDGEIEILKTGYDLYDLYPSGLKRAFHQDAITDKLIRLLTGTSRIPFALIGEEGVGKTTLVHYAFFRIILAHKSSERQKGIKLKEIEHIWYVDPNRVISGMSVIGMWQNRFESIISFLLDKRYSKAEGILYIDNIIALLAVGKSSQNKLTLGDVLKSYLERKSIKIIIEATPGEWKLAQEIDRSFTDFFRVLRINEPDEMTASQIIINSRALLENENGCRFDNTALIRVFEMNRSFGKYIAMPGAVILVLEQLAAKYKGHDIDRTIVEREYIEQNRINRILIDKNIQVDDNYFSDILGKRLIGQPKALEAMNDILHIVKARMNKREKPFGAFLFIGPTGVGKTEAAKVMAEFMFGNEDKLLRFDMNEYIDYDSLARLIGDNENPEGLLTSAVRNNPFSIILFDEIEKAHYQIHDLLLQVLGEGRLTDSIGRLVNFCHTIMIMTSNLGSEKAGKEISFTKAEKSEHDTYEKSVRNFFRPEFLNRIDKTVVFKKLSLKDAVLITGLQIEKLIKREGFLRNNILMNISPTVLEKIALKGFDQKLGGRALKRKIEKEITFLAADQMVQMSPEGIYILSLNWTNDRITPQFTHLRESEKTLEINLPSPATSEEYIRNFAEVVESTLEKIKEFQYANYSDHLPVDSPGLISVMKLRTELETINEQLQDMIWAFDNNEFMDMPQFNFRLKIIPKRGHVWKQQKMFSMEFEKQAEARRFLNELYASSKEIIDNIQNSFADLYVKNKFAVHGFTSFCNNKTERVLLSVKVYPESSKDVHGKWLLDKYNSMISKSLHALDVLSGNDYITFEGAGISQIIAYEQGFHLFLGEFSQPPVILLVSVSVIPPSLDPDQMVRQSEIPCEFSPYKRIKDYQITIKKATDKIIRIYSRNNLSLEDHDLYTDLKSGTVGKLESVHNDWLLLWASSLETR